MTFNFKSIAAFTLAEILITLAIIGVIAAITIPNLIAKYDQEVNIAKLKKIYKELSDINGKLNYEYGGTWIDQCSTFKDTCFRDLFAKELDVEEKCGRDIPNKCQTTSYFSDKSSKASVFGINDSYGANLLTRTKYSIRFRFHGSTGTKFGSLALCDNGWLQIDVNGLQKPNIAGKDIFFFDVIDSQIQPLTHPNCSKVNIKTTCKANGLTCAAYYLIENKR